MFRCRFRQVVDEGEDKEEYGEEEHDEVMIEAEVVRVNVSGQQV